LDDEVPGERMAVIAAPPLEQFQAEPDAATPEAVPRKFELPAKFLFYPAQFWPHKNYLRLVEAFAGVVSEMPDVRLVLTGRKDGEEYAAVVAVIGRLGLNDRMRILGYIEAADLRAIYRLAAMLVMPSPFESGSIPVYEAFQAGTL
jgi:glycosyltransferase involved in cell wall biosynthesis